MSTEDRIAALESILHAEPRGMPIPAMDAILSRAAAVRAEAGRTFRPWQKDPSMPSSGVRRTVDGSTIALVVHRGGWVLTVVGSSENRGPPRASLALATSIDEALVMADTVLAIAGWRLE